MLPICHSHQLSTPAIHSDAHLDIHTCCLPAVHTCCAPAIYTFSHLQFTPGCSPVIHTCCTRNPHLLLTCYSHLLPTRRCSVTSACRRLWRRSNLRPSRSKPAVGAKPEMQALSRAPPRPHRCARRASRWSSSEATLGLSSNHLRSRV